MTDEERIERLVASRKKWRELAIDAFHLLTLAKEFGPPPAFFHWDSSKVGEVADKLTEAVREADRDMYILEQRRTYLEPLCDRCGKFACVIGKDCCEEALEAGAKWVKER